jgi:DNA-binding IscR family transcriptional regulator
MKRDSRLSVALHTLLHMAEAEGVLTSEALAGLMETHPVVMRRTLAGLREAGIVRSDKGHGGGWTLLRGLDQVTLWQVYEALGMPTIFAIGHRVESPGCLVEQAVNRAVGEAFDAAEALLVEHLGSVRLSELALDVKRRGTLTGAPKRGRHAVRSTRGKIEHV